MTQQPSKRARPSPTIRVGVLGLFAAFSLVLPLALAPRADAYVYWANNGAGKHSIGRANLSGTDVEQGFIKEPVAINDIAVNATHIYWTYHGRDTIGRANLDGTGVVPDFFRAPGALFCYPRGGCAGVSLAVDSDHIYWTTYRSDPTDPMIFPPTSGIGRAKLDGTGVEADFIISGSSLVSLAVDRDHIYWTGQLPLGTTTIGRANLDGTAVDDSFISGPYDIGDVAVDHDHIYWASAHRIGRAELDGTGANQTFITGGGGIGGVAVDAKHAYWTLSGTLGRAKLDGTDVNRAFIDPIQGGSFGIAVDSRGPPGKATAKPTQSQKGKRIVVKVKVKARERLTATASGEIKVNPTYKLRPKKVQVAAGKSKTLKLKPKNKGQAKEIAAALKRGEKATAKLKVKLTDRAGNRETEKLRVRLKPG